MSFDDTLNTRGQLQGWLDNASAGGDVRLLSFDMSSFFGPAAKSPLIPASPVPVLSLPEKPSAAYVEWGGPAQDFNFEGSGG